MIIESRDKPLIHYVEKGGEYILYAFPVILMIYLLLEYPYELKILFRVFLRMINILG